jgi:hypothetical protein
MQIWKEKRLFLWRLCGVKPKPSAAVSAVFCDLVSGGNSTAAVDVDVSKRIACSADI